MLIHITPTLLCFEQGCKILEIQIPEISLILDGTKDITVGCPFPNKRLSVAHRKSGRRATIGILIDTPHFLREFKFVARWTTRHGFIATHLVNYYVCDEEHDMVTDYKMLWYPLHSNERKFPDRRPTDRGESNKCFMEIYPPFSNKTSADTIVDGGYWLTKRTEKISIPTIERDRFIQYSLTDSDRLPALSDAFRVG